MKSTDLPSFSSWHKWNSETVRKAPNLPGVDVFRLVGNAFGRLKGESDLVYIGCTESAHRTIRRRLSDHLPSRADAADIAHRLRDAETVGKLEVAWKILTTLEQATDEEARLLRKYYWDHFELPPVNRNEPASNKREAIEAVTEFIQTEQKFRCDSPGAARELAEKLLEHLTCERRQEKRAIPGDRS